MCGLFGSVPVFGMVGRCLPMHCVNGNLLLTVLEFMSVFGNWLEQKDYSTCSEKGMRFDELPVIELLIAGFRVICPKSNKRCPFALEWFWVLVTKSIRFSFFYLKDLMLDTVTSNSEIKWLVGAVMGATGLVKDYDFGKLIARWLILFLLVCFGLCT